MDMFVEAKSLNVMMKMRKMSQNEAAKMLGVSQSYVANKLRLLQLSDIMQREITEANLSERHARALLRLKNEEERLLALNEMRERGLSVAESEALIDLMRMSEMPKMVGQADKLLHTDRLIDVIKESLDTLSALGIESSHKVSYRGNKTIVTIVINNEK